MKKSLLELMLSQMNQSDAWKIKFVASWQKIVGELSSVIILEKIEDSKIFIKITNSCLANDLAMKKSALLKRFNKEIGQEKLSDVFLRTGGIKNSICKKNLHLPRKKSSDCVRFGNRENEALAKIKSQELQESLKKLFKICDNLKN